MIDLKFPDGASRSFEDGVTGRAVAASISPSLEKRALLVKLDGQLIDLDRPLPHGGPPRGRLRDQRHHALGTLLQGEARGQGLGRAHRRRQTDNVPLGVFTAKSRVPSAERRIGLVCEPSKLAKAPP